MAIVGCAPIAQPDHGEEGHAHDAEGNHITAGGTPTISKTIWTNKSELFVEFPALIVGKASGFAAHFTVLNGHQPVRNGSASVSLVKNGKGLRSKADAPSSPGIFRLGIRPKQAGMYQLIFDVKDGAFQDQIVIPNVKVYASVEEAKKEVVEEENPNAISFLKEQAWKIEFETQPVSKGEIFEMISTSGVWRSTEEASMNLVATTSGVLDFVQQGITQGSAVKKGDVLFSIGGSALTENNLKADLEQAQADYEKTKSVFDRKLALNKAEITPDSELEIARQEFEKAKAEYDALKLNYSNGTKQVKAPFDGWVKSIHAKNGEFAEEGTTLITLIQPNARLLESQVGAQFYVNQENIQNIWYETKAGNWSDLTSTGGKVLTVGKTVEKEQPNVLVYSKVNEPIQAPEGAMTEVQIAYGQPQQAILVPMAALLEDYGSFSVMVQSSGESFERRAVQLGGKNGDKVEVLNGLKAGEYVVTKGVYQVKMASMSGQAPAHGHEH